MADVAKMQQRLGDAYRENAELRKKIEATEAQNAVLVEESKILNRHLRKMLSLVDDLSTPARNIQRIMAEAEENGAESG
jgi:regulator of replication initiation timing